MRTPALLEVHAGRIDWSATSHRLHIRRDSRPSVDFSFRGQSDSANYVVFDLDRFVLLEVQR
jgi:hypothetical protein